SSAGAWGEQACQRRMTMADPRPSAPRANAACRTRSHRAADPVRFDSRIVARLPFVDTHVHYWDLKDETLRYAWLERDWVHPVLGDIDGLKVLKYMAPEFISETRFQNVSKAIHVQAAIGIDDPVEETRWLQEQADATGFPHGIVAHCDLAGPDAAATLDRHLEYANMRGVRDFGQGDYLVDSNWQRGYG